MDMTGGGAGGNGGTRGALVSYNYNKETRKEWLSISSKIYVYSTKLDLAKVKEYAFKIQDAINCHWNNPTTPGQGLIGRTPIDVVFDVSVVGVTKDEAANIISTSLDNSMSFFSLDGNRSHCQINDEGDASEFSIGWLEESGYTDAAHEYGHILGYFVKKTDAEGNKYPQLGEETHAYWRESEERNFIMGRMSPDRRVDALEYTRINQGNGLHFPRHSAEYLPVYIGNYFANPPLIH